MSKITITLSVTLEQLEDITQVLKKSPQARYHERNKDQLNQKKRENSTIKKEADAVSTSDKRYNRFVEFTNINDQVCTQVVSGTEESLDRQFAKNKNLKPRWVSPPLEQGMATMKWEIANEPSTRWVTDTSNSWRSL